MRRPLPGQASAVVLLIVALTGGLFATACDYGIVYSVENRTDQNLLTWPTWSDCKHIVGEKGEWLREKPVQPRENYWYSAVMGGGPGAHEPDCVLVTTEDRRLVMAEPYRFQAVYTVTEPLQAIGDPLPRQEDLPSKPWLDGLRDNWKSIPIMALVLAPFAAVAAGFAFAVFITVRFFYRYYRKGAS